MTAVPPPPPPSMPPPPMGMPAGGSTAKNGLGTWALVLGILSILCCGFLAGVPAIILGLNSKKAGEQGLATNGNLGNVGFILGIIGTALGLIGSIYGFANGFDYSFSTT